MRIVLSSAAIVALAWANVANAEPVKRSGAIAGKIVTAKGGEQGRFVPSRTFRKAEARQQLKQGDVLRTNRSGTLSILFANRTQIRLGRNSTLVVDAQSNVSLNKGKAWGRSPRGKSNLRVRTPSATAAIRGTEWAISADEDSSTLEVFEGEVELTNEFGSVTVGSGEAATVRRGQAPVKVQLVNPSGREQMLYYVRAEDALAMMGGPRGLSEAQRLVNKGEWEAAQRLFDRLAVGSTPEDRAIGTFGQYVTAAQLGQEPQYPSPENTPNSYLGRALIKAYEGDLRSAITLAEEGLVRFPDASGLYLAKARIALLLGEPELAGKAVTDGLAKSPDKARLTALDAEIAADYKGMPQSALSRAQEAAAITPDNPDVQQTLAEIWLERGGFKEALAATEVALATKPQDATLHALKAEVLLAQNEVSKAKASLDTALALEPDLSINRRILAEYYVRTGNLEAASEEALAASAGNPSFGRGFVSLAELYYQNGEPDLAAQQLDAAGRLDPFSPATPLTRTAIALHRFDSQTAILGARQALANVQNRGGEYINLSENQTSGSLVSQSFRFLNLEGWGRYYGDRVFDSFNASSYPDQFLNQTASPFIQRPRNGTFDSFNGLDDDFVSSFIQGAVLEPLSVVSPEKDLIFSRRNFFEGSPQVTYLSEDQRELVSGQFSATGLVNGGVPLAYSFSAERVQFNDTLPRNAISPFINRQETDNLFINTLVGFELSPQDKFVLFGNYDDTETINLIEEGFAEQIGINRRERPLRRFQEEETTAGLFWNHQFGHRDMLTLGGLYRDQNINVLFEDSVNTTDASRFSAFNSFTFLTANYSKGIDDLDLRFGAELSNLDLTSEQRFFSRNVNGQLGEIPGTRIDDTANIREIRAYADARYKLGEQVILQGQLSFQHEKNTANILANGTNEDSGIFFNVGVAYEPVQGQWLRGAISRQTPDERPFSFAPIAAIGLKPLIAPVEQNARVISYMARWDAEWSPRLFTSVEYQRQEFGALFFEVPSGGIELRGESSELDRVSFEVNFLAAHNLGIRANYALVESRAIEEFGALGQATFDDPTSAVSPNSRIPFVPKATAQLGATWTLEAPTRLKTRVFADYFGPRTDDLEVTLDGYVVFNATVNWQPFDRALNVDLGVFNLFDKRVEDATSIPGPRRTVSISASMRF